MSVFGEYEAGHLGEKKMEMKATVQGLSQLAGYCWLSNTKTRIHAWREEAGWLSINIWVTDCDTTEISQSIIFKWKNVISSFTQVTPSQKKCKCTSKTTLSQIIWRLFVPLNQVICKNLTKLNCLKYLHKLIKHLSFHQQNYSIYR